MEKNEAKSKTRTLAFRMCSGPVGLSNEMEFSGADAHLCGTLRRHSAASAASSYCGRYCKCCRCCKKFLKLMTDGFSH